MASPCETCKRVKEKMRGTTKLFICTLYQRPATAKCFDFKPKPKPVQSIAQPP